MQWRLNDSTRSWVEQTLRETAALQARIAALEAAGDRLAEGYARHDDDCPYPSLASVTDDDCLCGLNAARTAWFRAREDQP